jgi:2-polyprenyl-3-methyl-5-hydroxy-6-metoxy-1,4-benzoquinol methylase
MDLTVSINDIKHYTLLSGYRLITHQTRKKIIIKLICEMLPIGSKILDIGSANGDIAIELSILKYDVNGIEPVERSCKNAKKLSKKYGQNIRFQQQQVEDLDTKNKYNLLIMGEVLEHFYEPNNILLKLKKLLEPNGKILITAPNMPSLRNRLKFGLFGIFPDNNPEHKYHFDRVRFSRITEQTGFKINHFETIFTNLFLRGSVITKIEYLCLRWFNKFFKYSGDTMVAIISPAEDTKT